jgi:transcriptional regulator with XRE-family HTH domain
MSRWSEEYRLFLGLLKEARKDAGLSQRQAAKKLGRRQAYIWKSEAGERRLDLIQVLEFAVVYRKSLSFFARGIMTRVRRRLSSIRQA